MATLVIPDWDEQLDRVLEAAARQGRSKEAFVRESLARLLAPVTPSDEPAGPALLAQIRSVAAQAKHFYGLLDDLASRASSLRVVDFGEDLTR
jgi:plasmid stability protein